jgi:PPOX class probable F420-dependent enzyme
MINFDDELGQRVLQRLLDEEVIWLTTVDGRGQPQPRPVWFHWDGQSLLILSQKEAAKVRHIRRNPNIALHFNTDQNGGDVAVLHGQAVMSEELSDERFQAYGQKYRAGIQGIGMTLELMRQDYGTVILITPTKLRGF